MNEANIYHMFTLLKSNIKFILTLININDAWPCLGTHEYKEFYEEDRGRVLNVIAAATDVFVVVDVKWHLSDFQTFMI